MMPSMHSVHLEGSNSLDKEESCKIFKSIIKYVNHTLKIKTFFFFTEEKKV